METDQHLVDALRSELDELGLPSPPSSTSVSRVSRNLLLRASLLAVSASLILALPFAVLSLDLFGNDEHKIPPASGATEEAGRRLVALEELASEPERFDVGQRMLVEGFAIRPPNSVTFLCNELGPSEPPTASGSCTEVEGVPLTKSGRDLHQDGIWWDPDERSLDCIVVRRVPVHTNPERVVLSCVPQGSRP